MKTSPMVKVFRDQVVSGEKYLFRSHDAALRASRRVTANPGVFEYGADSGGATRWSARGDAWINSAGRRGVYEYGVGGKLLDVVDVEEC